MTIKIYTTSTCIYCQKAKEYFKEKNLEFIEINVENDEKSMQEALEKAGEPGVPVIDINGEIIHGWDKNAVEKALQKK